MLPLPFLKKNLATMREGMGAVRKHAHPTHRPAIDTYVRLIDRLIEHAIEQDKHLTRLENQVTDYGKAINRAENEKNQWKAWAQTQETKANQEARARQALQDKLDNLPPQPDAEDVATATAVNSAADDLPPAAPPPADTTTGTGGTDTTGGAGGVVAPPA